MIICVAAALVQTLVVSPLNCWNSFLIGRDALNLSYIQKTVNLSKNTCPITFLLLETL